jgi:hypothetical protein
MRWTEDQYAQHLARNGTPAPREHVDVSAPPFKPPANQAGAFALGRLPVGTMNKTEAAYARHLEWRKSQGEVLWYKFEGIKLRLADATFYTCDFAVLPKDGVLQMHECKGHWQDDARVKIKVAASIYPFRFIAARKVKDGWEIEEFS